MIWPLIKVKEETDLSHRAFDWICNYFRDKKPLLSQKGFDLLQFHTLGCLNIFLCGCFCFLAVNQMIYDRFANIWVDYSLRSIKMPWKVPFRESPSCMIAVYLWVARGIFQWFSCMVFSYRINWSSSVWLIITNVFGSLTLFFQLRGKCFMRKCLIFNWEDSQSTLQGYL